ALPLHRRRLRLAAMETIVTEGKNFALYLPALPANYCEYVVKARDRTGFTAFRPRDLNFLAPRQKLWRYPFCLASAGSLAFGGKSNAITQRDPKKSWVMGDSGGYQIATGAVKGAEEWRRFAKKPAVIAQMWGNSGIKHDILRWQETHCDCAMTIDMPAWARGD